MNAAPFPPGPKGRFLIGNLPDFRGGRLDFLLQCAREYGDFIPLRFGPRRVFLLNHPDLIEQALVTNHRDTIKGLGLRRSQVLLGNGLLTSEGDFWRRQRKLMQPAFHRERIAAYGEIIVDEAERMLAGWREGETRPIHEEMMRLTLSVVVKTLFGAEVAEEAAEVGAALGVAQENFSKWMNLLLFLPRRLPTPTTPSLRSAVRRLDAIIYALIARRRNAPPAPQFWGETRNDVSRGVEVSAERDALQAGSPQNWGAGGAFPPESGGRGGEGGDLLTMLLHAQDEDDGGRMTDRQLRDEVMTLFLAGHETTALALTWAWYLLAQNPAAEAKLEAELEAVLGGRTPTVADRGNLRYAEWVALEAMRLYPPVWAFSRETTAEVTIGDWRVPPGCTLLMSQWISHRDPRYFDDPETFRPERWADDFAKRLPKYAYFPFGGGPRICIGNTFAMTEAVLLLAAIAQRFRLALAPGQTVTPQPALTLRPQNGVLMTLHRRESVDIPPGF